MLFMAEGTLIVADTHFSMLYQFFYFNDTKFRHTIFHMNSTMHLKPLVLNVVAARRPWPHWTETTSLHFSHLKMETEMETAMMTIMILVSLF